MVKRARALRVIHKTTEKLVMDKSDSPLGRRQFVTSGCATFATFYINKFSDRSLHRLVRENMGGTIRADLLGIRGSSQTLSLAQRSSEPNETAAINDAIQAISESLIGEGHSLRTRLLFPAGVYGTDGIIARSDVWLDFGGALIRKQRDGHDIRTNGLIRVIPKLTGNTYYGSNRNIRVSNGVFDPNGFTAPAHICGFIFCEDLLLENLSAVHRPENISWAFQIGGRRIRAKNISVYNGTKKFQDGIHVYHGEDIEVWPGTIVSGDDCIAIGSEATDPWIKTVPDAIRRITVHPCSVRSTVASCIKIYRSRGAPDTPAGEVSDIKIMGVKGIAEAGVSVIVIDFNSNTLVRPRRIRNIDISASVTLGSKRPNKTLSFHEFGNGLWMFGASGSRVQLSAKYPQRSVSPTRIGTIRWCTGVDVAADFGPIPLDRLKVRNSTDVRVSRD